MTRQTLHTAPPVRTVIVAQLRAVGTALRPSLIAAGTLLGVLALVSAAAAIRDGEGIAFVPEFALLATLGACLLPVAVWRGEYRVRRSYLSSLPVDRSSHLLSKLGAGWAWLMLLTGIYVLGMLTLALVTGGAIGVDEMRVLARDVPAGVTPLEADAYARRWTTPGWQWTIFFTTATVAYLFGSAFVLAGTRARRWSGFIAVLILFMAVLAEQGFGFGSVGALIADGAKALLLGPYGLATLYGEAGRETLAQGQLVLWRTPPSGWQWLLATLMWVSTSLAAVLLVVIRDRRG